MSEDLEIKNKIAESGLINFDLSTLLPKGKRIGIDLKDFLFEGLILKEKDFREKIFALNLEDYENSYIYIYNLVDTIVPLCDFFLRYEMTNGAATANRAITWFLLIPNLFSASVAT